MNTKVYSTIGAIGALFFFGVGYLTGDMQHDSGEFQKVRYTFINEGPHLWRCDILTGKVDLIRYKSGELEIVADL